MGGITLSDKQRGWLQPDRERIYKDIYESDRWKTKIAPRLDELRDASGRRVLCVIPTKMSPAQ